MTTLNAPLIDRELIAPEKEYILTARLRDSALTAPERMFSSILFSSFWTNSDGDVMETNTGADFTFDGFSIKIISLTAPIKINIVTAMEIP